jgi:hypothetical protein
MVRSGTGVGIRSGQSHEVMDLLFALLKRWMALAWLLFQCCRCLFVTALHTVFEDIPPRLISAYRYYYRSIFLSQDLEDTYFACVVHFHIRGMS